MALPGNSVQEPSQSNQDARNQKLQDLKEHGNVSHISVLSINLQQSNAISQSSISNPNLPQRLIKEAFSQTIAKEHIDVAALETTLENLRQIKHFQGQGFVIFGVRDDKSIGTEVSSQMAWTSFYQKFLDSKRDLSPIHNILLMGEITPTREEDLEEIVKACVRQKVIPIFIGGQSKSMLDHIQLLEEEPFLRQEPPLSLNFSVPDKIPSSTEHELVVVKSVGGQKEWIPVQLEKYLPENFDEAFRIVEKKERQAFLLKGMTQTEVQPAPQLTTYLNPDMEKFHSWEWGTVLRNFDFSRVQLNPELEQGKKGEVRARRFLTVDGALFDLESPMTQSMQVKRLDFVLQLTGDVTQQSNVLALHIPTSFVSAQHGNATAGSIIDFVKQFTDVSFRKYLESELQKLNRLDSSQVERNLASKNNEGINLHL